MKEQSNEIEQKAKKEAELSVYLGPDRVVLAEEKRIEIEAEKKTKPHFRATTGLMGLDECVDGFRKGQLVVLSGPPKHGKSSLAKTFTKSFTAQGIKCVWFSYELAYEELFENFPMENLDFYVPNVLRSGNLDCVQERILEAKFKHGATIAFIDHLDYLRDPNVLLRGISVNYTVYLGGIVQRLKSLAVEYGLVIFLLAHLTKTKWASNQLPSSEELADTRHLAQLADIVMMIMRKRAPKTATEDIYVGNEAVVGVVENRRNGKTRKFPIFLSNNEFIEMYDSHRGSRADVSPDW